MSSCMSSYSKKNIIFTCLLRNFFYSLVVGRVLFLSCDEELNPGPHFNYTQFTNLMKKYNDQISFLHPNCQSMLGQRLLLENFQSDLGDICILGISETWLKSVNNIPFWSIHTDYLMSFRCDRGTDLVEGK